MIIQIVTESFIHHINYTVALYICTFRNTTALPEGTIFVFMAKILRFSDNYVNINSTFRVKKCIYTL